MTWIDSDYNIRKNINLNKKSRIFTYVDNNFHYINVYNDDGMIDYQHQYINGKYYSFHAYDAISKNIQYVTIMLDIDTDYECNISYKNGKISCKDYYYCDVDPIKYHREDGPAYISYNEDETIEQEEYFFNGECITDLVKNNPTVLTDAKLRKILL